MKAPLIKFRKMLLVLVVFFFVVVSGSAQAQDQSATQAKESNQNPETSIAQKSADQSTDAEAQPSDALEVPQGFQVTKLGSAQWLEPNVHSLLHLGPLYVGSVSASFVAANTEQFNATQNQTVSGTDYFGLISSNVIYDKLTRAGRFTFQYLPELAIFNGTVETNLSNQSLSFAMTHALSPRWTLSLSNGLSYVNGRVLYGNLNLDVNSVSGNGVQSPFLQTTQSWLRDGTSATLGYQLSSRDQLTVTATYNYSHSDLSTLPQNSNSYGGSIGWSRALSQTKSVGLFVQLQEAQYSTMFPSTLYKGFGGSFSDRLSATWVMQIGVAASIGNAGAAPTQNKQNNWTGTGSVTLRKDFLNSSLALDGYRGITTGPFLTNGYTNRFDGNYSRHLTRRLQGSAGAAYEQDSYSGGHVSGTYGTGQVTYLLSRSFSCFAAYAHRWQSQSQSILGNGQIPANTFSTGLTWNLARSSGVISPVIY